MPGMGEQKMNETQPFKKHQISQGEIVTDANYFDLVHQEQIL